MFGVLLKKRLSGTEGCRVSYSEARALGALLLMNIVRVTRKPGGRPPLRRSFDLSVHNADLGAAECRFVEPKNRQEKVAWWFVVLEKC